MEEQPGPRDIGKTPVLPIFGQVESDQDSGDGEHNSTGGNQKHNDNNQEALQNHEGTPFTPRNN